MPFKSALSLTLLVTLLATASPPSLARAEVTCTPSRALRLWNAIWKDLSGDDQIELGYVPGYGLMAYTINSDNTCHPWFLINSANQGISQLQQDSSLCVGTGNDDVSVSSSIHRWTGGPGAQLCSNLPFLEPFKYNGFALIVLGESGHDSMGGGDGPDIFYGGVGFDAGVPYNGTWNQYFGESDPDSFLAWRGGTQLYGDGSTANWPGDDILINFGGHGTAGGIHTKGGYGNDCIEDRISDLNAGRFCDAGWDTMAWQGGTPPAHWGCEVVHPASWPFNSCGAW